MTMVSQHVACLHFEEVTVNGRSEYQLYHCSTISQLAVLVLFFARRNPKCQQIHPMGICLNAVCLVGDVLCCRRLSLCILQVGMVSVFSNKRESKKF